MQPIGGRREAQARADRIRSFREELGDLERASVVTLTPEQRAQIDAHHDAKLAELAREFDIDTTEAQKKVSWGMRIASTLGAIALCTAAYLFFQRIWGLIPVPVQVGILIAAPLILLVAAEMVRRRERTPYYTFLLSAVSVAAFVVNVGVVGEMFNMTPSPGALLVWGVYALALAYHFRLRMALAAGLISLVCYFAGVFTSWSGSEWIDFGERPENFILAGGILLFLAAYLPHPRGSEFRWVYRLLGLLGVLLPMLILSASGNRTYIPLEEKTVEAIYEAAGLIAAATGIWLGIRMRFVAGVNVSAVVFVIVLFMKLYDWWWEWMPKYLFFLLIGAIAVALVAAFKRIRGQMPQLESV